MTPKVPGKTIRIWFQNKRCKSPTGQRKSQLAKEKKKAAGRTLLPTTTTSTAIEQFDNNSSNSEAEEESHVCHLCRQAFSSKWNLKMHQQRFHERQAPDGDFTCSQCGRVFAHSLALKVHYSKRHSKPQKSRPMKSGLTKMQKERLAKEWDVMEDPSQEEIIQLASELKVTVKQITGWLKKRKGQQEKREERASIRDFGNSGEHYGEHLDGYRESKNSHDKLDNYYEEEEDLEELAPKLPYNPGHKKTKFSEFQRNHLRQFFQVMQE